MKGMSDKATGIASKYEGESPSDKSGWAQAVRDQEKNMQCDYSMPSQNKGMIRKYKGK